jgi:hypothetical protein
MKKSYLHMQEKSRRKNHENMRNPNKTFGVNAIMAKNGNVRENFRVEKEKPGDVTRLLGKCSEKDTQYTL